MPLSDSPAHEQVHTLMVRLELPARPSSLRLVRAATTALAADLGFDVAAGQRAGLAVDELATSLIGCAALDATLTVSFRTVDGGLSASGSVRRARPRPRLAGMAVAVLDSVASTWHLNDHHDHAAFGIELLPDR